MIFFVFLLRNIICYNIEEIERRVEAVKSKIQGMEIIFGNLGMEISESRKENEKGQLGSSHNTNEFENALTRYPKNNGEHNNTFENRHEEKLRAEPQTLQEPPKNFTHSRRVSRSISSEVLSDKEIIPTRPTSNENATYEIQVGEFIIVVKKLHILQELRSMTWKVVDSILSRTRERILVKGYFFGEKSPQNGWFIHERRMFIVKYDTSYGKTEMECGKYKIENDYTVHYPFYKLVLVLQNRISLHTLLNKIKNLNKNFPMTVVIIGIYLQEFDEGTDLANIKFPGNSNMREVLEDKLRKFRKSLLKMIYSDRNFIKERSVRNPMGRQRSTTHRNENSLSDIDERKDQLLDLDSDSQVIHKSDVNEMEESEAENFLRHHYKKDEILDIRPNSFVLLAETNAPQRKNFNDKITDALSYYSSCCSFLFNFSIFVVSKFSMKNFTMILEHEIRHSLGFGHGVGMKEIYKENETLTHADEEESIEYKDRLKIKRKLKKETEKKIREYDSGCFEL